VTYTLTIACLANSRKLSGRCVAGRVVQAGQLGEWIRPVSARPNEEISEEERRYENGSDPQIMDVIKIPMREARPTGYQQENHLIDPDYYWERVGHANWADIQGAVEDPGLALWPNGYHSSYGVNDRVPADVAATLGCSLYLVQPENIKVRVVREGASFGNPRRRVRANFNLSGSFYSLVVTDPVAERLYLAREDGEDQVRDALLCTSLGEVYQGFAYKLVATLITRD
jgi:hypothetical protein